MHIQTILEQETGLKDKAMRLRKDPDHPFPVLSAKFKLTWACNLRCVMCMLWREPRVKGGEARSLAPETVMKALTSLAAQGLRKVHFSGGEVLLYPYFQEVADHARNLDLQVNITTNGTRITKDVARFLVDQRVHTVTVSLDGPDARTHDRIRGVKGAFKASMEGIGLILGRKSHKGRGPKLAVNTVVSRKTMDLLPRMYDLLRETGIDAWRILPMDTEIKALRPTGDQWESLFGHIPQWRPLLSRLPLDWRSERSGPRAEQGKYAGLFYGERICYAPWFHVFVDADGRMYPCCNGKKDMTPFAVIHELSMDQALLSRGLRDIRYSLAAGHRFPVCDSCDDFLEENQVFNDLMGSQSFKGE